MGAKRLMTDARTHSSSMHAGVVVLLLIILCIAHTGAIPPEDVPEHAIARRMLLSGDLQGAIDELQSITDLVLAHRVSWAIAAEAEDADTPATCPPPPFRSRSVPVRRVHVDELADPTFAFGTEPLIIRAGAIPAHWQARRWPRAWLDAGAEAALPHTVEPLLADASTQFMLNRWTSPELAPLNFSAFVRGISSPQDDERLRRPPSFANARIEMPTHPALFQALARGFSWPIAPAFARHCRNLRPDVLLDRRVTRDPGVDAWKALLFEQRRAQREAREARQNGAAAAGDGAPFDRDFTRLLLQMPSRAGVWVSDGGLHTVPHHDWADGLLAQAHGRKHAVLLALGEADDHSDAALRLLIAVHKGEHEEIAQHLDGEEDGAAARLLRGGGLCAVRGRLAYVLLDAMRVPRYEAVLEEGEVLYLPRRCAHDITSLTPGAGEEGSSNRTEGTVSIRFYPIECG